MLAGFIKTCPRQAAYFAQIGEECGQLKYMTELIDDATAERQSGERQDLENIYPGEGALYKGRGALMLIGRINYHNAGIVQRINNYY